METNYDVVIIGSGLGGLVCGYILAKNGYKVVIVEKNHQIGGCLQTFTRKGVKFDTGMHYIGSLQPGQVLHSFFNYLNLHKDVKVNPLDPDGYDTISLAGEEYKFANGYEHFIDTLAKKFPNNYQDIKEYIRQIRIISESSPLNKLREVHNYLIIEPDYIKKSINDFISSITQNQKLQYALVGNLSLYAGIKDQTPVYIHALINDFYIQSAYRIIGGSDAIAFSLANSIRSFGGEILTSHEVLKIICDDTKATEVLIANGKTIKGKAFISNIHPEITIDKIESLLIRKVYKERIRSLQNSIANFTVYMKFKPNSVPYFNSNLYHYDIENPWNIHKSNPEKFPESFLFMHQCHKENIKYAETAQLICYMDFEEVKKWGNSSVGKRGEEYEHFKKEKAELLLKKLEQSFSGIRQNIDYFTTSSPLTYRDYTATKEGSMYGIIRDKNSPAKSLISQRTKIPNLFLTGQNINTHGILGVIIGAIITSSEFININTIISDIRKS